MTTVTLWETGDFSFLVGKNSYKWTKNISKSKHMYTFYVNNE